MTMVDQSPTTRARRSGGHWVLTAAALRLSPLLLAVAVRQERAWDACIARHGSPAAPSQGPCAGSYSWLAVATLGFWALAIAATVTGAVIGVVEGRRRRRFAHGRWISMGVVGLCAPWALAAYALGYGAGRLLPASRPNPVERARRGGWQEAVRLYAALAGGQPPPQVLAPDLRDAGTVYMDVPLRFSRYYRMDVRYQPGGMIAVGSPSFVAGAMIGRSIGASIGYLRAAGLSRFQWRGHHVVRVVVTATATWCQVQGRWLAFDHTAVLDYRLGPDQSCVLTFGDIVPLRLHGPSVWCHAVLYAYLRYGAGAWLDAAFLYPLRQAAQQFATAAR
jgi:hypothetical protein